MNKDEVRAKIEEAFADTPPPGNNFEDISATKWDEGIVDYFRGKTWRGHRVLDLRHHSAALSFFSDQAFRYWLPAFMLAELENPEDADIIAEVIASHLTDSRGVNAMLGQFQRAELEAIAAFLDECAQRYEGADHFRRAATAVRARLVQA